MVRALIVFTLMLVVNIAWARYIQTVSDGQRLKASLWDSTLFLLGGITVTQYTKAHWLLIPATLGAFVGTFIGAKRGKGIDTETATGPGVPDDSQLGEGVSKKSSWITDSYVGHKWDPYER